MAIANADGSVVLSTKIDTSGIGKSISDIKNKFASLRDQKITFQILTQAIKDQSYVIRQLSVEHANLVAKGKGTSTQAVELKGRIDTLTAEMKEMQWAAATLGAKTQTAFTKMKTAAMTFVSYFIGIQTIFAAIRFSGAAAEFATQTESSVQRLVDIYGEAAQSVGDFIDANARAIGMSRSAGASIASTYGNLFSVWADQKTNAELTNSLLNQTAVVASKTGRTTTDVADRIRSGLLGNTEAIEDLGINVNIKTIEITDAFKRIANGRSWEQLNAYEQSQVRTLAILEQSTNKYGTTVAETTATVRSQYQAAYEDFQNTWGQVVNTVLIPVLKILTQFFTIATKGLQVLAGLSGKTVENSGNTSNNIKQQTKEQEKLNKAVKKGLAGFDEINTLTEQSAENTADAGAGTEISGIGDVGGNPDGSSYVKESDAILTAIMGVVSVSLIAIGILLCATGHIGWGIGFIIAGAGLLAITQASVLKDGIGIDVQNALTTALLIVGVAAIVLGIILCMCSMYGRGIALIALGAVVVVGTIAINWDSIKNMLSNEKVAKWVAIGGMLAIVLGLLLCFVHQWWLGIGLIALGATAFGITATLNWDAIKNIFTNEKVAKWLVIGGIVAIVIGIFLCCIHQWVFGIGLIALGATSLGITAVANWGAITEKLKEWSAGLAIVGIALVVLGILLCVAQVWTFGIGAIVAGIASIVTVAALNWQAIKTKVVEIFNAVVEWVKTYGLLVLGILLCLTGAGIPLGIALIIKWAKDGSENGVSLATTIVDKVKEVWSKIKEFWKNNVAKYFTATWWGNLAKKAINGFLRWMFDGLNKLIEKLNSFGFDLPEVLGGGRVGFNIQKLNVPQLAKGAVIPGGREFLAVLGDQPKGQTNIEAPLDTIKQAVAEVLAQVNVGGGGFNGRIEVPVIINGREIARAVRDAEYDMGTQTVFGGFANAY